MVLIEFFGLDLGWIVMCLVHGFKWLELKIIKKKEQCVQKKIYKY